MANTAYICRVRTDIPAGVCQITDLHPNTSQANSIYTPNPQSGYVPARVQNDTLAALVANATTATYQGLAAYLIDRCIETTTVGGLTITVTMANASAAALIAISDAGGALTETAINNAITGAAGKTVDINANGSEGSVTDILKILAGGVYTLPSGSVVGGRNTAATALSAGSFDDATIRQLYVTGALQISCGVGVCSTLASATFSYKGVAGRAISVYDSAGNNLA